MQLLYVVRSVTLIIPPDCLVNAFIAHVITKGKKARLTVLCLADRGRRARTGSYCCSSSTLEEEEWEHRLHLQVKVRP